MKKKTRTIVSNDMPLFPTLLPSVPFLDASNFPVISAIYFALTPSGTVLYIGATANLSRRLRQHHRAKQFTAISGVHVAYYACPQKDLAALESAMIRHFQPSLNAIRDKRPHAVGSYIVHEPSHTRRMQLLVSHELLNTLRHMKNETGLAISDIARRALELWLNTYKNNHS